MKDKEEIEWNENERKKRMNELKSKDKKKWWRKKWEWISNFGEKKRKEKRINKERIITKIKRKRELKNRRKIIQSENWKKDVKRKRDNGKDKRRNKRKENERENLTKTNREKEN